MSWNQIMEGEIEPTTHGALALVWTCPRCGYRQTVVLNADELFSFQKVSCQNVNVCGEGQSYFELVLSIEGSYKGLLDRPLNTGGLS